MTTAMANGIEEGAPRASTSSLSPSSSFNASRAALAPADDAHDLSAATAEIQALLSSSNFSDLRTLIDAALQDSERAKSNQREVFLSHAPTLLSLDAELESSISSLDQLSVFLTTFSNDLGLVSSQISSLEEKSKRIEEELKVKRALQAPLERMLKGGLVLDPRVVEKIFEKEPDRSWVEAVRELERSLEATRKPLDQLAAVTPTSASGPGPRNSRRFTLTRRTSSAYEAKQPSEEESSFKALHEAREVVEATKVMAASKIRTYLVAPFNLLKVSVSTNLQVLQTSILLPHHQPLYAFLARQMPRVAIDVQRAYVSAARLYFETGFRRYARSLTQVGKRGYTDSGGEGGIADVGGGLFSAAKSDKDTWMTDPSRLEYAKVAGPGVTLGYMGDDTTHKEPPEALYRSLALVFFDNACSEYTFIVRYFETLVSSQRHHQVTGRHGSARRSSRAAGSEGIMSPTGSIPPTPITEWEEGDTFRTQDDDGPPPSDSASVAGGQLPLHLRESAGLGVISEASTPTFEDEDGDDEHHKGDLVQLSKAEQSALKGRGAADEIFKKIFEPVTGTWLAFSRALLTSTTLLPLMSLLCMIQLTDHLLDLSSVRGAASVLTGPLLQFKMEAWPLFQRRFQDEIEAVLRLAGEEPASGSSGAGAAAGGYKMMQGWMSSASATLSGGRSTSVSEEGLLQIAARYGNLYSQVAHLTHVARLPETLGGGAGAGSSQSGSLHPLSASTSTVQSSTDEESSSSLMLFSSLLRLRNALEKLLEKKSVEMRKSAGGEAAARRLRAGVGGRVKGSLEKGPGSISLQRIQSEMSFWSEVVRKAG